MVVTSGQGIKMNKYTIFIVATLLAVFLFTPLSAQQNSVDAILAWFPHGRYIMLEHFDLDSMKQQTAYQLYADHFIQHMPTTEDGEEEEKPSSFRVSANLTAPQFDFNMFELPEALKREILSVTRAQPLEFTDLPNKKDQGVHQVQLKTTGKKGPAVGIFLTKNNAIAVYTFYDLATALEDSLNKGQISDTGKTLAGRPIYSFKNEKRFGKDSKMAWVSRSGEMLVAENVITIKRMLQSYNGEIPSIVDNPDYVDLVNLFPDLGQAWHLMSSRQTSESIAESARDKNIDDERIESLVERARTQPLFTIKTALISREIKVNTFEVYEDANIAEEIFEDSGAEPKATRMLGLTSPEFDAYQKTLAEKSERELNNHIIMNSLTIDEQMLARKKLADEALAKAVQNNKGRMTLVTKDGKKATFEIKTSGDEADPSKKK